MVALDFDPVAEAARNWRRVGWRSVDAMAAATSITRAHQILLGRINEELGPYGLTFSRFEALALLHFTRTGALPLGKMGERLQVHPASVTNTVDRLEQDGLVVRRRDPDDGRTRLAEITPAGRELVATCAEVLGKVDFGLDGEASVDFTAVVADLTPVRGNAGDLPD